MMGRASARWSFLKDALFDADGAQIRNRRNLILNLVSYKGGVISVGFVLISVRERLFSSVRMGTLWWIAQVVTIAGSVARYVILAHYESMVRFLMWIKLWSQ